MEVVQQRLIYRNPLDENLLSEKTSTSQKQYWFEAYKFFAANTASFDVILKRRFYRFHKNFFVSKSQKLNDKFCQQNTDWSHQSTLFLRHVSSTGN